MCVKSQALDSSLVSFSEMEKDQHRRFIQRLESIGEVCGNAVSNSDDGLCSVHYTIESVGYHRTSKN